MVPTCTSPKIVGAILGEAGRGSYLPRHTMYLSPMPIRLPGNRPTPTQRPAGGNNRPRLYPVRVKMTTPVDLVACTDLRGGNKFFFCG